MDGGGVILFITALCSETGIVHIDYISNLPHWIKYGIPAALIVLGAAGCKSLFKPGGMLYKILSVIADLLATPPVVISAVCKRLELPKDIKKDIVREVINDLEEKFLKEN